MKTRAKEEQREPEVKNGCKHYWIIEPANGATSIGVCKVCKAKMEFYNFLTFSQHTRNTQFFNLPELVGVDLEITR
jgi:hypothetical protein